MKCSRELVLQFSCLVEHLCQQFCVKPFVLKILLSASLKTLARSINDKSNILATLRPASSVTESVFMYPLSLFLLIKQVRAYIVIVCTYYNNVSQR